MAISLVQASAMAHGGFWHRWRQFPLVLALAISVAACSDQQAFDASDDQLTLHVADAALAAGAPDLALNVTDSILAPHPHDVEALATKGDALYMKGQSAEAGRAYRELLAIDPDSVRGQLGLGRTLLPVDLPAAEAAFLHALHSEPRNVAALSDLGIARDLEGRSTEAQQAYRQALDIAPDDPATLVCLGLSLALSGDAGTGVRILRPLASDPNATSRLRDDLALALTLSGDTLGAERTLRTELSQPEIATVIADYRAFVTTGAVPAVVAQIGSASISAEPAPSAVRVLSEESAIASAAVVPVDVAGLAPAEGPRPNKPPAPATGQTGPSIAALPGELPLARRVTHAPDLSIGEPQRHEPLVATRPAPAPALLATAVAHATAEKLRSAAASPSEAVRSIAATRPDTAAPVRAADGVPVITGAPIQGWLAESAADATIQFAITEPREFPDGAMLAVAAPADLPVTDMMWSWLGESGLSALTQLSSASVASAIAAAPPVARAEAERKPVLAAGVGVSKRQPYVQVAALGSQQAAMLEWERLRVKMPDLMNDRAPTVVQAEVNGRMFWRLRTSGFATLAEANQFCGRIQAAGSGCWTVLGAPSG